MQQAPFDEPTAPRQRGWRRDVAFVLCLLATFGLGFSGFLLLPKYLTELGASAKTIGVMSASMSVAVVVATPLSAYLIGRLARPQLIRLAALLLGSSSLAFLVVPEPGLVMVGLRLLQGVAFSLVLTACSATVVALAPPQRLGRLLGYVGATMLGSQAVAPALFEPLTERLGWSALFVGGAVSAVMVTLSSFRLPNPPALASRKRSPSDLPVRVAGMVLPSLMASTATGFSFGAVITFAPAFALSRGAASISSLFLAYTALALGVRILAGGLGDSWGHARVAVTTVTVYAVVVFGFVDLQPAFLPLLGGGLGLAHGLLFPSLNALALADTPEPQRGRVQAFFFGAFHLGVAASGLTLGVVADSVGFPGVFAVAGVTSLAAAAGLTLAARRRGAFRRATAVVDAGPSS
jgi:MFS family permease